jgi:DNA-directed RNA polymerase specialized sigma24 family protein
VGGRRRVGNAAKPQSFGNRSQLKTWLVGILNHKVIDILRQRSREVSLAADEGDGSEELEALVFKAEGHFMNEPSDWGGPEQELNSRQFFAVLHRQAAARHGARVPHARLARTAERGDL